MIGILYNTCLPVPSIYVGMVLYDTVHTYMYHTVVQYNMVEVERDRESEGYTLAHTATNARRGPRQDPPADKKIPNNRP